MKKSNETQKSCTVIKQSRRTYLIIHEDNVYKMNIELIDERFMMTIFTEIPGIKYYFNSWGGLSYLKEKNNLTHQAAYDYILNQICSEKIEIELRNGYLFLYWNYPASDEKSSIYEDSEQNSMLRTLENKKKEADLIRTEELKMIKEEDEDFKGIQFGDMKRAIVQLADDLKRKESEKN